MRIPCALPPESGRDGRPEPAGRNDREGPQEAPEQGHFYRHAAFLHIPSEAAGQAAARQTREISSLTQGPIKENPISNKIEARQSKIENIIVRSLIPLAAKNEERRLLTFSRRSKIQSLYAMARKERASVSSLLASNQASTICVCPPLSRVFLIPQHQKKLNSSPPLRIPPPRLCRETKNENTPRDPHAPTIHVRTNLLSFFA